MSRKQKKSASRILAFLISFAMVLVTFWSDYSLAFAANDEVIAGEQEEAVVEALEEVPEEAAAEESEVISDENDADGEIVDEAAGDEEAGEADVDEADAEEADADEADAEEVDAEEVDAEEVDAEEADAEEVDAEEVDAEEVDVEEADAEEADVEETDAEEVDAEAIEAETEEVDPELAELEETVVELEEYTLYFEAGEGGFVTNEEQVLTEEDEVDSVTAIAYSGYQFVNWTKDGEEYSTSKAITPELENATYVANFEEIPKEFSQSTVVNGIRISLYAVPGVLPNDAELQVTALAAGAEETVQELIDEKTEEDVIATYSFDIYIFSASEGGFVQPEDGTVAVTFEAIPQAGDADTTVAVYHVDGALENAEQVSGETNSDSVSFEAGHFSIYTVTVTAGSNSYVIPISLKDLTHYTGNAYYAHDTWDIGINQTAELLLESGKYLAVKNKAPIIPGYEFSKAEYKNKEFNYFYYNNKNNSKTVYLTTKENTNNNNVIAKLTTPTKLGDVVFYYKAVSGILLGDHLDLRFEDEDYAIIKNSNLVTVTINGESHVLYDAKVVDGGEHEFRYDEGAVTSKDTIIFYVTINGKTYEKAVAPEDFQKAYNNCPGSTSWNWSKGFDFQFSYQKDFIPSGSVKYYVDGTKTVPAAAENPTGESTTDPNATIAYTIKGVSVLGDAAPTGYRFLGWATASNSNEVVYSKSALDAGTASIDIRNNQEVKLYGIWQKTYTVTFTDGVADTEVFADQITTVDAGSNVPAFTGNATREGYAFKGWNPAWKATDTVNSDLVYTAVYNPIYTVTYVDGLNGAVFATQSTDVESGSATPAFTGSTTREGYVFKGWDKDIAATVTGNVTYTAQYKKLYTVTITDKLVTADDEEIDSFDRTPETGIEDGTEKTYAPLTTLPEGYDINGFTVVPASQSITVNEEANKAIVFKYVQKTVTVTFMDGDEQIDEVSIPWGTTVSEPEEELTKEQYDFIGWYLENAEEAFDFDTVLTENTVLYATWADLYTIRYVDGVEDEVVFEDQVYQNLKEGDATPEFEGSISRAGYDFVGWDPEFSVEVSGSKVYTAMWEKRPVLKVVVKNDGSQNKEVMYNGEIQTLTPSVIISIEGEEPAEFVLIEAEEEQAEEYPMYEEIHVINLSDEQPISFIDALIRQFLNTNTLTVYADEELYEIPAQDVTFGGRTYTVSGMTLSGTKHVEVGEYEVKIHTSGLKIEEDGEDVSERFDVEAPNDEVVGKLTITKRSITLTADSAEKVYDGAALTADGYTVSGDGFVGEDAADVTVTVTGSQTEAGTSANVITAVWTDKIQKNYNITLVDGTLTVTEATSLPEDSDDDDDDDDRAEEAGSVLGADRGLEATPVEDAVEEGGAVLGADRGRSPKTNDASNAVLWAMVMGSSTLGLAAILAQKKRREEE